MSQRAADLRIVADSEELARGAAREFRARAAAAVRRGGFFAVALSGGATPRRLYRLLAGDGDPRRRARIPWSATHVFWTDERRVPPDDPGSNYRAAWGALLSRVPIPPANIHRMRGEDPDAGRAARLYERDLRSFFRLGGGRRPRFDLVLLGVGRDGHVASIFPRSSAARQRRRLAVAVRPRRTPAIRPAVGRITLTLPVINEAGAILVLAGGEEKAGIVRAVLRGRGGDLPARRLRPRRGDLIWMIDRAAARSL